MTTEVARCTLMRKELNSSQKYFITSGSRSIASNLQFETAWVVLEDSTIPETTDNPTVEEYIYAMANRSPSHIPVTINQTMVVTVEQSSDVEIEVVRLENKRIKPNGEILDLSSGTHTISDMLNFTEAILVIPNSSIPETADRPTVDVFLDRMSLRPTPHTPIIINQTMIITRGP